MTSRFNTINTCPNTDPGHRERCQRAAAALSASLIIVDGCSLGHMAYAELSINTDGQAVSTKGRI